jgi:hypothetical protein
MVGDGWDLRRGLRVEFERDLPVPSYYECDPEPVIVVDLGHWDGLELAGRVELLAREVSHHILGAVYPGRPRGIVRALAEAAEERARRAALHALVPDYMVAAAIASGLDDIADFAQRWGRSVAWATERLILYCVQQAAGCQGLQPW